MRRVRTLVVLFAMVCAVFAGSTSIVSAGTASIATTTSGAIQLIGKRWGGA